MNAQWVGIVSIRAFCFTFNYFNMTFYQVSDNSLLNNFRNVLFSGNGHHVMLDIGKVRLLREILKEASFSDQEEVLR